MHRVKLVAWLVAVMVSAVVNAAPAPLTPLKAYETQNAAELAAFKKAIREKYDMKEKAFAQGDADTILQRFYAGDEITVGAGQGIYFGRKDITKEYKKYVGVNKVKIDSIRTYVNGNAGWDWADFHVMPTDGSTPYSLAILFLWSKIDGNWVCMGDFFVAGSLKTGKLSPPPPEAAPVTPPAKPTH